MLERALRRQNGRKPSRCQRRMVSGPTRSKASRQRGTRRASGTSGPRSCARNTGRRTVLDATMSCCRSSAFSAMSSSRQRGTSAAACRVSRWTRAAPGRRGRRPWPCRPGDGVAHRSSVCVLGRVARAERGFRPGGTRSPIAGGGSPSRQTSGPGTGSRGSCEGR